MGLPRNEIRFSVFGGVNASDQPSALIARSHDLVQNGYSQKAPVESPGMPNMDFLERALGKRLGSALLESLVSVLISDDTILKATSFITPGSATEVQVAAGAKGLYTNQSGTWARLTNANSTAFQWNIDSTKISFVMVDNHLIIMSDKNFSQIYRAGTALDNQMHNSTTVMTSDDQDSTAQKVVRVDVTTGLNVGDRVSIDTTGGGGGVDIGYIASISDGVSYTLEDDLSNQHEIGDLTTTVNLYTESKGGGTQNYTGDWTIGHYIGIPLHERFCMCRGDSILEFTDVQQPYDLAGGSFVQADGNIVAATAFVPKGGNELNPVAFLSTTRGPEIMTGFDPTDTVKPMQGGSVALNHQCITTIDNWVLYFTREGTWEAANYNETLDLGRRFKTLNGTTGPLDTFSSTNSNHDTVPFVYRDEGKKQVWCYYPDASGSTISKAVGLDFYLGEPVQGEPLESFEQRVRCLHWSIKEPTSNIWFASIYIKRGAVVGCLATGVCYTIDSGNNDLDTIPIREYWEIPDVDAGFPDREKNWRGLFPTFKEEGDWDVAVQRYLDLSQNSVGTDLEFPQVLSGTALWNGANWNEFNWAGASVVAFGKWLETYSKHIRLRFLNQNTSEPWILRDLTMEYQIAARSN